MVHKEQWFRRFVAPCATSGACPVQAMVSERREVPCCWMDWMTGRVNKLHLSFMRIKILQACYTSMSALEGIIVLFLLIDTDLDCDYVSFYQTKIVPTQIAATVFFQVVSGIFTDISQKYANRVAQITCFTALILDPIMFFLTNGSPYLVLGFFVMRFGLIVQVGNSCGKLLKMRLDKLNMREENQVHAFNNVTITGDVFSRITVVFFGYALVSLLVRTIGIGFEEVKIVFFTLAFFWDCMTLLASLFIESDYFVPEEDDTQLIDINPDADSGSGYEETAPAGGCAYFKESALTFLRTGMLWSATLHLLLNILISGFIAIVLRFEITGGDEPTGPVGRNNFCGGSFINVIDLQSISEMTRLLGAFVYQFLLTRARPYHFFSRIWMVMGFGSIALLSANYFALPPLAGSVILSLLNVISYLSTTYDNCIVGAVVPPDIVGFTFAVQGVTLQLLGLIPVFISLGHWPKWVLVSILNVYTLGVITFTFYIVRARKQDLFKLDDPKQIRGDGNRFLEIILGYK